MAGGDEARRHARKAAQPAAARVLPKRKAIRARLEANRLGWNYRSDRYQRTVGGPDMYGGETRWGPNLYRESELNVLGDVAGKDVLEVGCGGAQFGITLALRGARVTGIDLSASQLRHARRHIRLARVPYRLERGNAEDLSRFSDASFDIVTSDYAMGFMDLDRLLPEVARVLRPGGFCAFSWSSPVQECMTENGEPPLLAFVRSYFDRSPFVEGGKDPTWEFKRTYGDWVRSLSSAGLTIEDLIEPQTPRGGTHSDWPSFRWQRTHVAPGTVIWKARKPAGGPR
jgi:ubiquinone/menaquinone biosynthesis C-methylase UbiE